MADAANKTRVFLGGADGWKKAKLELPNIHGLYGGNNLTLEGSGKADLYVEEWVDEKKQEKEFHFQLTESETKAIFDLLVENDVLGVPVKDRAGIPDEMIMTIQLTNSQGKKSKIEVWSGDLEKYPALSNTLNRIGKIVEKKARENEPKIGLWKRINGLPAIVNRLLKGDW